MKQMNGIAVSPGISVGTAFVLRKITSVTTGERVHSEADIQEQITKYDAAVERSVADVLKIKNDLTGIPDNDAMDILETHLEFLTDPQIKSDVEEKIREHGVNAGDALIEVIAAGVALFNNMNDAYMRARSADLQDIGDRILQQLVSPDEKLIVTFPPATIIIAEEVSPSDTMTMDTKYVIGFATQSGGSTSHAAIIARAKGIPAVVGCGGDLATIVSGDLLILDGDAGELLINPTAETVMIYKSRQESLLSRTTRLKLLRDTPATTTDGRTIALTGNISGADDLEQLFESGGEGVGLFRTEFMYLARNSFPTEEEQFVFYKKVALHARGKEVIVRTIDIGGDKQLSYFGLPPEQNPFLGYRAIRICLDQPSIFITQIRAILRASAFGKLKIMFPMIASIAEIRSAKLLVTEAKNQLTAARLPFDHDIEIGIMIEIPAAAVAADLLAREVDFFSIGTNDLCQYTLAVDRMNEKIKDLYDPFHPAVLRLIRQVIEQGQKNNIHVGMCGEMAGDPLATLLLTGMGLSAFSMSASSMAAVKEIVIRNSYARAKEICKEVMDMDDGAAIRAYLREQMNSLNETNVNQ